MLPINQRELQVSSYAVRDIEEYRNFCDRSKDQRPQPHEVLKVTILLRRRINHSHEKRASCELSGQTEVLETSCYWLMLLQYTDKYGIFFYAQFSPRQPDKRDSILESTDNVPLFLQACYFKLVPVSIRETCDSMNMVSKCCRIGRSIWAPCICLRVSGDNDACIKAPLHQAASQTRGYVTTPSIHSYKSSWRNSISESIPLCIPNQWNETCPYKQSKMPM